MPQPQTAICAEGETFAAFLTLMVTDAAAARRALRGLPALGRRLAGETDDAALSCAVAVGAAIWPALYGSPAPRGLAPFQALADGPRQAPATPADLFLHVHGQRPDSVFALARAARAALGAAVTLVEEIHGFRTRQSRDLTGFVDGTENPCGAERPEAALVGDEDPAFAAGSHVSLQRYVHDLAAWERLSLAEQEAAVGRSKADDVELDDKPASAHIARVVIEDEDGAELQVVRHSLPYGGTDEHGLYFVAYARSPAPFRRMLEAMVRRDGQGHGDRLLDFSRAVTGAAFFAPSCDFLEQAE
ncbi:putative deferrochelatase/peroxidase YfeX [mine drainage metagenome]|uniref:Putative deferrochelatase/peroxidase YfeX n=1 Tax=mine drainage metagenome TaxID=410659 RepID=A0A1J5S1P8_9ZZZZ